MSKEQESCSFCGKNRKEVDKLIMGHTDAYICNFCVDLCQQVLNKEPRSSKNNGVKKQDIPYPDEIHKMLSEYVIGQENAKKALSIAAHNHYKRIENEESDVEIEKSNILLLGPTGSGKTWLAKNLAKVLDVPFAMADATSLTEAGYVGEDVESILLRLLQNSDDDIKKAESGIIYIDEIDKISRKSDNPSITRDVSGEGVQQALLKIIEGTVAAVPPQGGRKHPNQDLLKIDTKHILFIVGGAFVGIDDIISQRLNYGTKIGFGSTLKLEEKDQGQVLQQIENEDLKKFGMIPEFLGRFPILVSLNDLSIDELIRILKEPRSNLVEQYQAIFRMDNISLEFSDCALEEIAKECLSKQTGARGLKSAIERVLFDVQYNIGNLKRKGVTRILVTKEMVFGENPMLFFEEKTG